MKLRIRRVLAVVVATAALLAPSIATPASAASTTVGLFGSSDPTYDGVYRQSMAVLGLTSARASVPAAAVSWLVAQQCASGAYQSFRADTGVPCGAPDPQAFSGPDSNSTALAAMALAAAGRTAEAKRAVAALRATQNADGGWGYTLGGPSDVNSTGLALAAVRGLPPTKEASRATARATAYLRAAQLPCTAPVATRLAMPYQAGQPANALASVQALVGISGTLPAEPIAATPLPRAACSAPLVQRLAWHVDRLIRSSQGRVPSALDSSQVDWNATATGVIALASAGAGPRGIAAGITSLGRNTAAYVGTGAAASPAALGTLIQAATAAGKDPRSFGSTKANLVSSLLVTLQR